MDLKLGPGRSPSAEGVEDFFDLFNVFNIKKNDKYDDKYLFF